MHTKVCDGRILTFGQNRVSVKRFETGSQQIEFLNEDETQSEYCGSTFCIEL